MHILAHRLIFQRLHHQAYLAPLWKAGKWQDKLCEKRFVYVQGEGRDKLALNSENINYGDLGPCCNFSASQCGVQPGLVQFNYECKMAAALGLLASTGMESIQKELDAKNKRTKKRRAFVYIVDKVYLLMTGPLKYRKTTDTL